MIVSDKPYIPQNVGEILDQVRSMMLGAPTFKDKTGYFPGKNIDTEFVALNEALLAIRKEARRRAFRVAQGIVG